MATRGSARVCDAQVIAKSGHRVADGRRRSIILSGDARIVNDLIRTERMQPV